MIAHRLGPSASSVCICHEVRDNCAVSYHVSSHPFSQIVKCSTTGDPYYGWVDFEKDPKYETFYGSFDFQRYLRKYCNKATVTCLSVVPVISALRLRFNRLNSLKSQPQNTNIMTSTTLQQAPTTLLQYLQIYCWKSKLHTKVSYLSLIPRIFTDNRPTYSTSLPW